MSPRWQLRGLLLPEGAEASLWVAHGRISRTPLPDCEPLSGAFISPGLVDGHVHISWSGEGETLTEAARSTLIAERRLTFTQQGTLLVRDMGAPDDALLTRSLPEAGLARVIPSGRIAVRYDGYPFPATRPGELVAFFRERLAAGARWIKVFADWTDDFGGSLNTGFSGDDEPCYSLEELRAAVEVAHAGGARVAAHAFSQDGCTCAVLAGVDSLEHGWGVHEGLLREMAARGTAWLPLLAIARGMSWGAENHEEQARLRWIQERLTALTTLLPSAVALGIPVLAGTDWGPGIPVAREVVALHERGLSATQALAAATTTARAFFGAGGLSHGDPADIVLFDHDPREDLSRLAAPTAILMGGQSISPTPPPAPEEPPAQGSHQFL